MSFPIGLSPLDIWQVDVFTGTPLRGNPAAVVFGAAHLSDERLQDIARETNLSETVFIYPPTGNADYRLRTFTCRREIPFAVHPTLAAAHAFAQASGRQAVDLVQECPAGLMSIAWNAQDEAHFVAVPPGKIIPTSVTSQDAAAMLGLDPSAIMPGPIVVAATGVPWMMIELRSAADLSAVQVDHGLMARITRAQDWCVGVTAFTCDPAPGVAAQIRAFAPAEGIYEDPVCGSCAGALAFYLLAQGRAGDEAEGEAIRFSFLEGIEIKRPGTISVHAKADTQNWKLEVGGKVVTVMRGRLEI